MTMTTTDDDRFHDLLDRWEELREQGQEPSVEDLCQDAPHLADRLREWTRVLKTSDWLDRRADEVADETIGEAGTLTAEEKDKYKTLGEYELAGGTWRRWDGAGVQGSSPQDEPHGRPETAYRSPSSSRRSP